MKYFSLVYFHDIEWQDTCTHTVFQYCIFMKVANALIHDDEWVCRDSDHKYEEVSMIYCPATAVYLPAVWLSLTLDVSVLFLRKALSPLSSSKVVPELSLGSWAKIFLFYFFVFKQSINVWVGVLHHFKISSWCLSLSYCLTFQAVFSCSEIGK